MTVALAVLVNDADAVFVPVRVLDAVMLAVCVPVGVLDGV